MFIELHSSIGSASKVNPRTLNTPNFRPTIYVIFNKRKLFFGLGHANVQRMIMKLANGQRIRTSGLPNASAHKYSTDRPWEYAECILEEPEPNKWVISIQYSNKWPSGLFEYSYLAGGPEQGMAEIAILDKTPFNANQEHTGGVYLNYDFLPGHQLVSKTPL